MLPVLPSRGLSETGSAVVPVERRDGAKASRLSDVIAVEEPLEIRLVFGPEQGRVVRTISITMRTPGHDLELAAGFLLTEGIIRATAELDQVRHAVTTPSADCNIVCVELRPDVPVDMPRLERHVYTTSSCGVCGKTSLNAVRGSYPPLRRDDLLLDPKVIYRLPDGLRPAQSLFDRTGGLHAAGLFDEHGRLLAVREDVGRHNAVDKLVGGQLLAGRLPLARRLLFLSGRASFELVQKALAAGIPVVAAVGAPSSLAVDLASESGMTLLGFVRDHRFNIYSGDHRIAPRKPPDRSETHVQPAHVPAP